MELSDIQAEPVITTLDNKKADIIVGEEVPVRIVDYSTSGGVAGQQPRATVSFKETGIRLTVTPHVTNNRQILMSLKTERSSVKPLAAADLGFSIDKQATENQLLVADGETAVIGGLTVTTVQRTRNGIPLLSSLPLIGNLFSFSSNSENRKDLTDPGYSAHRGRRRRRTSRSVGRRFVGSGARPSRPGFGYFGC